MGVGGWGLGWGGVGGVHFFWGGWFFLVETLRSDED